jgi:hypothetical protein
MQKNVFRQVAIVLCFLSWYKTTWLTPFLFILMAESSSSTISFSMPNIAHLCQSKLDDSNYLGWVFQFEPILKYNGLMGIVNDSNPSPPKHVPAFDKTLPEILNPEYTIWERKDQCILSWFIATLTPQVVPIVYGFKISAQVWTILSTRYASPSRSHVTQL